jgi:hypothetical protein
VLVGGEGDAAVGVCCEVSIVATLGRSVVLLTVEVGLEQFSEILPSDPAVVHKYVNCTSKVTMYSVLVCTYTSREYTASFSRIPE